MAPLVVNSAEATEKSLKKRRKQDASVNDVTDNSAIDEKSHKKEKKKSSSKESKKEKKAIDESAESMKKKRRRETTPPTEQTEDKPTSEKKPKKSRSDETASSDNPTSDDTDSTPAELRVSTYRISQPTQQKLKDRGIVALFPIQAATFDAIFDGKDVVGRARTGTGKTLSFALPVIERLLLQPEELTKQRGRQPRVLVMCPTRELAKQVSGEFESVLSSGFRCLTVYGGTPYWDQERVLRDGCDIIVGTPGRIQDHLDRGNLRLQSIQFVILDE
jgi:ATP-dependent RNA helicase DDX21